MAKQNRWIPYNFVFSDKIDVSDTWKSRSLWLIKDTKRGHCMSGKEMVFYTESEALEHCKKMNAKEKEIDAYFEKKLYPNGRPPKRPAPSEEEKMQHIADLMNKAWEQRKKGIKRR